MCIGLHVALQTTGTCSANVCLHDILLSAQSGLLALGILGHVHNWGCAVRYITRHLVKSMSKGAGFSVLVFLHKWGCQSADNCST